MSLEESNTLFSLRSTAAALVALAVKELFPDVLLQGGGATSLGFYYDFFFPFPFQAAFIKQIEERVFDSLRRKEPVVLREMVPFSAREWLLAQKEPFLVKRVEASQDSLVSLCHVAGRCVFLTPLQGIEPPEKIGAFKLLKTEETKVGIRLHGTAFPSKGELFSFLKERGDWIGPSHVALREGLFDWMDGELIWLAKGQKWKEELLLKIRMAVEQGGGEWISCYPLVESVEEKGPLLRQRKILKERGGLFVSEAIRVCPSEGEEGDFGLLDESSFLMNLSSLYVVEPLLLERVISCLHFVTKIFKIFGLESRVALVGGAKVQNGPLGQALAASSLAFSKEKKEGKKGRIEWRVMDRLGIEWPISALYAPEKRQEDRSKTGEGMFFLPFSLFFSLERVMGLMLEDKRANLSSWWKGAFKEE